MYEENFYNRYIYHVNNSYDKFKKIKILGKGILNYKINHMKSLLLVTLFIKSWHYIIYY